MNSRETHLCEHLGVSAVLREDRHPRRADPPTGRLGPHGDCGSGYRRSSAQRPMTLSIEHGIDEDPLGADGSHGSGIADMGELRESSSRWWPDERVRRWPAGHH